VRTERERRGGGWSEERSAGDEECVGRIEGESGLSIRAGVRDIK